MFKNKSTDGCLNICGISITALRKKWGYSQRALADNLQRAGLDVTKNTIQQIEAGKRFVTDIELAAIAAYFGVTADSLVEQ